MEGELRWVVWVVLIVSTAGELDCVEGETVREVRGGEVPGETRGAVQV